MNALVVFGTRPEAIKLAPVIAELRNRGSETRVHVCVTGQHRHMLDQVLNWFRIVPDFDLDLMTPNQNLSQFAGKAIAGIGEVLDRVKADLVVVQGDTATTMAAALAASYHRVPVAHVEAGLRTYDMQSPFPEELNRRVTSVASTYHFAPTERAARALYAERTPASQIYVTGNTVIDAIALTLSRPIASRMVLSENERLILVTAHRRESFGGPFESICRAIRRIAERNSDVQIVYPVHLNPNVREPVNRILAGNPRIQLLEPLRYEEFVHLMAKAHIILTDSGGIQEEASFLGKPTLVMRETTERQEALEAGTAQLVGTSESGIANACQRLLEAPMFGGNIPKASSPFGDGHAARCIVDILLRAPEAPRSFQGPDMLQSQFTPVDRVH